MTIRFIKCSFLVSKFSRETEPVGWRERDRQTETEREREREREVPPSAVCKLEMEESGGVV